MSAAVDIQNLAQAFLDREAVAGVAYRHNDYVRVIGGPFQGENGSLVSLLAIETDAVFLVELETGGDVEVNQSQLCLISHDS